MIASPRPFWSFVWPRDTSINAAGFAVAGFAEEAQSIVKWLLDTTPESRIHEARYFTDRTPMLLDNRLRQGDNPGYIAWATSFVCKQKWDIKFVNTIKAQLFALADLLLSHVDPDTLLPLPESDYWEMEPAQSISIAASAMGGLLGAAYVAKQLGEVDRAELYRKRAEEIKTAASKHLWNSDGQYFMSSVNPTNKDTDVAVCLGVHPFEAWDSDDLMISASIDAVKRERWNEAAGGMVCLPDTPYESFWFYHTTIFLLGVSSINDSQTESAILTSLERNITPQGLVPEQIGSKNGHLWGGNFISTAQACLLMYAYFDRKSIQEEI